MIDIQNHIRDEGLPNLFDRAARKPVATGWTIIDLPHTAVVEPLAVLKKEIDLTRTISLSSGQSGGLTCPNPDR